MPESRANLQNLRPDRARTAIVGSGRITRSSAKQIPGSGIHAAVSRKSAGSGQSVGGTNGEKRCLLSGFVAKYARESAIYIPYFNACLCISGCNEFFGSQ